MAEYPAMPLWTDAYLADTTDLSAEEHGVYLLLLMAAWRSPGCCLPDDNERLARMARVGTKKWAKMRPVMARFFTIDDRGWTQKRLLSERDRLETSRSQKRQAANAKWLKEKKTDDAAASAEAVQNGCNPYPYPYPYPEDSSLRSESSPSSPHTADRSDDQQGEGGAQLALVRTEPEPDFEAEFKMWWAAYPHKVGRPAGRKAFKKARRKASLQTLIDGVQTYIRTKPADRQWCNPATWLNQERWLDEPLEIPEFLRRTSGGDHAQSGPGRGPADPGADGTTERRSALAESVERLERRRQDAAARPDAGGGAERSRGAQAGTGTR